MKAEYTYDAEGRIKGIGLRDGAGQLAKAVGYEWDKFGQLATRFLKGFELPKAAAIKVSTGSNLANGLFVQKYRYDKIGRLVGVECPDAPELCESYVFDQSGNIVSKTIGGQTVEMTYDLANQLISKAEQGSNEATSFTYDAAGRMTGEAIKGVNVASYAYGYLDKVLSVNRQGSESARFSYDASGMLVGKEKDGINENWVWDGISLAAKGKEVFVNESHASGGVPIMASKLGENGSDITADFLVNDYLGTTIASTSAESADQVEGLLVASLGQGGEAANASQRFTGKPYDADLGAHVFPFRNYRTDIGRWMSSDPSGFPDGPNGHYYAPVPTIGLDPTGLYYYNYIGSWTSGELSRFQNAVGRMRVRIDTLIQEAADILASEAMGCTGLTTEINSLLNNLNALKSNFDGNGEIKINKADLGTGTYATWAPGFFGPNTINLNYNSSVDWMTWSQSLLDEVMLHEFSHDVGTEDDDSAGQFNNAYNVEDLMALDIRDSQVYDDVNCEE